MRRRNKYYIYFFVTAMLLQFIAVVIKVFIQPPNLSFTLYNETYTVNEFVFIQCGAVFYFLAGLGYWILRSLKRKQNDTLSVIHSVVTVGGLFLYLFAIPVKSFLTEDIYDGFKHNDALIMLMLPAVAIAQVLYAVNIAIGIRTPYHRHKRRQKEY